VLIGMRDTPEQVGETSEIPGARRLEVVERVERLAQRRELRRLGTVDAQPGPDRLDRHIQG
jgi:hypothetical protein